MNNYINVEDRILVVAPHPDDESIGCGGLISAYHEQIDVVLATDGVGEDDLDSEYCKKRQKEFQQVMTLADVHEYKLLHIPEGKISKRSKEFRKIDFSKYTCVFVPNRYECHKDHRDLCRIVKKACRRTKCLIYEYEVWTPLRKPNIYFDIADEWDKKQKMIDCYQSQMEKLDYIGLSRGLNTYRGLSHGIQYAESFFCRKKLYASKYRALKRFIRKLIKK